jgi:hypothetical protein
LTTEEFCFLGEEISVFTAASRSAPGYIQLPVYWAQGVSFTEGKVEGHEADHSPPSRAEIKNAWSYTSTPSYVSMMWYLIKQRDTLKGP